MVFTINATEPNVTTYYATCLYPISGNYTFPQRLLFYLILTFIFLFRVHDWLTAGGIAFCLTYSSTAAIHGILLSTQKRSAHDADLLAVQAIVQPALIAGLILRMWSPRLFDQRPKCLYDAWTALCAVANLILIIKDSLLNRHFQSGALKVRCDSNGCTDACAFSKPPMFRSVGDGVTWLIGLWEPDELNRPLEAPHQDLAAEEVKGHYRAEAASDDIKFIKLVLLGAVVLALMVSTLLNFDVAPAAARNNIFGWFMTEVKVGPGRHRRTRLCLMTVLRWFEGIWEALTSLFWFLGVMGYLVTIPLAFTNINERLTLWLEPRFTTCRQPSRLRLGLAYVTASAWYLWASLAYVTGIVLWIYNIVRKNEGLQSLPQAENFQEIGQWSPFVGVTLAVVAACISKIRVDSQAKKRIILADSSFRPQFAPLAWLRHLLNKFGEEQNPWQVEITLAEEWKEAKLWFKDPMKASGIPDPPEWFLDDGDFELANTLGERRSEEGRLAYWSLMQEHAYATHGWSDVGCYADEDDAVEGDRCTLRPPEAVALINERG